MWLTRIYWELCRRCSVPCAHRVTYLATDPPEVVGVPPPATVARSQRRFCGSCGAKILDSDTFCGRCGADTDGNTGDTLSAVAYGRQRGYRSPSSAEPRRNLASLLIRHDFVQPAAHTGELPVRFVLSAACDITRKSVCHWGAEP